MKTWNEWKEIFWAKGIIIVNDNSNLKPDEVLDEESAITGLMCCTILAKSKEKLLRILTIKNKKVDESASN